MEGSMNKNSRDRQITKRWDQTWGVGAKAIRPYLKHSASSFMYLWKQCGCLPPVALCCPQATWLLNKGLSQTFHTVKREKAIMIFWYEVCNRALSPPIEGVFFKIIVLQTKIMTDVTLHQEQWRSCSDHSPWLAHRLILWSWAIDLI